MKNSTGKTRLGNVIFAAALMLLVGCASVSQTATTVTDPKTGVVTQSARSHIIASGDSKLLVEKVRASAGKTSSVGASGVQEESTTAGLQAMTQVLVNALLSAYGRPPVNQLQVNPNLPPVPPPR